jgi:hypothetical protein
VNTFDFNRSFLRFRIDLDVQEPITVTHKLPTSLNNVRINLECRCELTNRRTGRYVEYVLGASCKTEIVGVTRDVWMQPNADFCLVASEDEFLVLKSWARTEMPIVKHSEMLGEPCERQSGNAREAWTDYGYELRSAQGRSLRTIDEVIASIRSDAPLVARTKYNDGEWSVSIEYPVKTINYSERENIFQTDTGPILLPDLSVDRLSRCNRLVECFDLAFAAFNSSDWAEFIINVPTPVGNDLSVNHYSKPRRIEPVENLLMELQSESVVRQVGAERAIRLDGAELPSAIHGSVAEALDVAVQGNNFNR